MQARRTPLVGQVGEYRAVIVKVTDSGSLGARLRVARKARRRTLEQMASLFGVTHSAVSQWENDKTTPDLQRLIAAAESYDVSIDWLVWGGDVSSGIESRIRKIHPTLRAGLVERLHREIDETMEAEKRLPKEMLTAGVVKDADRRLDAWSAKGKPRLPPPKDN